MGLTKFRPITPSGRYKQVADFAELTTNKPHWPLTISKHSSGGRNNHGHITKRGRGGGHKRRIRIVDFKRIFANAKVADMKHFFVEHDMPANALESITTSMTNIKKIV